MKLITVISFVWLFALARASDVPAAYLTDLCGDINRGLDCCAGLAEPEECIELTDCPTSAPATTAVTTPCPTFPPPAPCPTEAPAPVCPISATDTCNLCRVDQLCISADADGNFACVCPAGSATFGTSETCTTTTLNGTVSFVGANELPPYFYELDEATLSQSGNLQVQYLIDFNKSESSQFVIYDSLAVYLLIETDQSLWNVPATGTIFNDTAFINADGATLEEVIDGGFLGEDDTVGLDLRYRFNLMETEGREAVTNALTTGGVVRIVLLPPTNVVVDAPTQLVFERSNRLLYRPEYRTNYGEDECFHGADCDLGLSTCDNFDQAFPDAPGNCNCTWGDVDAFGSCPQRETCTGITVIDSCTDTLEFVDTGGESYEVQCNANAVQIVRQQGPGDPDTGLCDQVSLDLAYSYASRIEVKYLVTHADGSPPDITDWTLTLDDFQYENKVANVLTSTLNVTEDSFLTAETLTSTTMQVTGYVIYNIANVPESTLAVTAKEIFDNGSKYSAPVILYTGATDNRYVFGGCTGCNPRVRDTEVECYFLTTAECAGGCDYTDRDTIDCTAPTPAPGPLSHTGDSPTV